jgi:hypothetical protein
MGDLVEVLRPNGLKTRYYYDDNTKTYYRTDKELMDVIRNWCDYSNERKKTTLEKKQEIMEKRLEKLKEDF